MKRFQMAGGHLPPGLTARAGCKALGRALRHRSCARGSQRSLDGAESSPYYLSGNSGSITQHPPRCSSALKNNPAWSSVSPQVPVFLGFHLERQHLESIIQSLISSRFSPPALHASRWILALRGPSSFTPPLFLQLHQFFLHQEPGFAWSTDPKVCPGWKVPE